MTDKKYYKMEDGRQVEISEKEFNEYEYPPVLNEDAHSQATLAPKSMPFADTGKYDDDVKQALERFNQLNAKQKERYMDFLPKVFDDSAWVRHPEKKGKNIPINRNPSENYDFKTVADFLSDELDEAMEGEHYLTDEFKEKAASIFMNVVEAKWHAKSNIVGQALNNFVEEYGMNPFTITDEELDCVQLLTDRIELLEQALNLAAIIKEELIEGIQEIQERSSLQEETNDGWVSTPTKKQRRFKRSSIEEEMLTPDEDNADALYNSENQVGDFRMQQYLRAMG
jgi:hypothetical protein